MAVAANRKRRRVLRALPSPAKLRPALAILLVITAAIGGGLAGMTAFRQDKRLSVGTITLSTTPFHKGALDVYVPLVDWGIRFRSVRFPARVHVDVRSVNRKAATRIAGGGDVDVRGLRQQADHAIGSYLRWLLAIVLGASLLAGLVAAVALRSRAGPRLRWLVLTAVGTSVAGFVALVITLPPRGQLGEPEYYANGGDIPRALKVVEAAASSSRVIDEEVNGQLVGIARLVVAPSERQALADLPRITLASDLHDNVVAIPTLERAAAHGPLFFPGDLTNQGTPLETSLVKRVVHAGRPFLFVTGNHDSPVLAKQLAQQGAIVLTQRGQLLKNGRYGPMVVRAAGLRVAGYSDPFQRQKRNDFQSPPLPQPSDAQKKAFMDWLLPLVPKIDAVMVHEPVLASMAMDYLRQHRPDHPITFFEGHTHLLSVEKSPNVIVINDGSIGAGGPANAVEHTPLARAVLTYEAKPRFKPFAVDTVQIDPGTGSAKAQRERLDSSVSYPSPRGG
ncbi:MAG: metallophosphoesterase family protein [Gaiellaceae bacterium]